MVIVFTGIGHFIDNTGIESDIFEYEGYLFNQLITFNRIYLVDCDLKYSSDENFNEPANFEVLFLYDNFLNAAQPGYENRRAWLINLLNQVPSVQPIILLSHNGTVWSNTNELNGLSLNKTNIHLICSHQVAGSKYEEVANFVIQKINGANLDYPLFLNNLIEN